MPNKKTILYLLGACLVFGAILIALEGRKMSAGQDAAVRFLGMALLLAAVLAGTKPDLFRTLRASWTKRPAKVATATDEPEAEHRVEDASTAQKAFGYKTGWIAVRSADRDAVTRALGLRGERRQDWQDGLAAAYDMTSRRVAVTPSVEGWVLIVGGCILDDAFPAEPAQRARLHGRLAELSRTFGEALLFATYRVTESHSWGRWRNGESQRLVSYCEGELKQSGAADNEESEMLEPDEEGFVFVDEEMVMRMAAAWSISPEQLDDLEGEPLEGSELVTGLMS